MICIRVTDFNHITSVDSFPEDFIKPIDISEKKGQYRYTRIDASFGTLEILVIKEDRISGSNQVFNAFVNSIKLTLEKSLAHNLNKAREMADDYLHNITKIHGNQKSIVERCIAGAEGQENYDSFVSAVEDSIKKNPDLFAEDICALSKEIRLVDYHIGGYNLLNNLSSRITITNNHNLKNFLLGLCHLFFESFKKNNVMISLHGVNENFLCSFEYETFNIAMHSFLENTVKYSKPYSKILVYTNENSGELVFEMESIRIERDEIPGIFERGVSGRLVPNDLRGSGIGMYQVKKALDRSKININISQDFSENSELNEIKYTKNFFSFSFPRYTI